MRITPTGLEYLESKDKPERIHVTAAVFHAKGMFFEAEGREEDFWLFLGRNAGWGRFSNKKTAGPFELVEIVPANSTPPDCVESITCVLWRRQDAVLADKKLRKHNNPLWKIWYNFKYKYLY